MKVTTLELKPNKAVLKIENTKPYFVNSLRRIMLSELPKLAIEDVIIYDNTTPLFDEIIAHRLGMIPLPTDLKLLTFRDQCTCKGKGCPNCTVRYTLSKEGEGVVYSGDLQPEEKSWAIKEDKIPIVELTKDQRLILEVEAILGRGKDHAKWQAVQAPAYKYYPIIEIDHKKCDLCKKCIEECPKNILEIKNKKLSVKDIEKCTLCRTCMDVCEKNAITVRGDENKFIFRFETDGSLTAKEALLESASILEKKYEELGKLLKKLK
ncbi:MAG: DNA-directed RNA polymerase subunit D [Thermoplasmata archaeon]|nr:MAG: DNA-directed RNA polymerase subunit D [Thermoplasmata archaeon]